MDLNLKGKNALVTGASKGIGLAIAHSLAGEGCNIHLAARNSEQLEKNKKILADHYKVHTWAHRVDLALKHDRQILYLECQEIDILINNAGAIPQGGLEDITDKQMRDSWELKLFGYIDMSRHIYSSMKKRGSGVIINVIGSAADNPSYNYIAGSVANVALANFTIALGKESQKFGVRVIAIHPAITKTERMITQHETLAELKLGDKTLWKDVLPEMPFDRPTEPVEVADMVTFLASDRASYTSGVVFKLTNGL